MKTTKKTLNKRAIVALILLAALIAMPITGILVHLSHAREEVSHSWLHYHVLSGIVFMVAGIYHVVYNWRTLKHYLFGKKQ